MLNYPRKNDLAQIPTPLVPMHRASERWGSGHRLWVKRDDLTGSTLSGNKVRKLEYITAYAQDHGYDTLITCGGIQSNHCRATAFAGAQLGMQVHLILRGTDEGPRQGNLLLDYLAGAAVSCYPVREYVTGLESLFEHWQQHYASQGRKALAIPTGGSDGIGLWGYIAACEELRSDFAAAEIGQAHIVSATGSGGTQAGLTLGAALHQLDAQIWGVNVCDDEQYFLDKVDQDIAHWYALYPDAPRVDYTTLVLDGHVGEGYGRASEAVFDTIAELAALEGLALDPVYTGKAFHGMVQEIQAGRFAGCQDIVFMHTGGIFGLFPQGEGFRW
ncbi:D-cysteine desulfhydrase [Halioglobus japonicus]|uniref:D-cysteine desulfhydrase family protein n=1 Tax=Halioglobus japonicus TaxID=930805 RepID=A0AAP8SNR2_9GAMM|nr:D-cysteine desulfhydrase family protein [Halioglobus japonicus]AQA18872.1 D-cysteine desulfhydrase [Halioglobus japonicus]PLW86910.1 D-cysteine desulfhydrase family protein [Halioglobus japonicus]GHD23420.1 putative 1-aminocyclopropane-1-carboxylate deaminase [Halioglobus japonicus]